MDGYQFIASMFQSIISLAWPAAFVVAVWLFREKLTELLPLLRLKYKDLDISFQLNRAEKDAAALPRSPGGRESEPTPEERDKFEEIARLSPRAAIVSVRADLEEAVRALGRVSGISLGRNVLETSRILRNEGIIDSATFALLNDLRSIGNSAAHNATSEIHFDEAMRFKKLADDAIQTLRSIELRREGRL
jgi:hypothetical protein